MFNLILLLVWEHRKTDNAHILDINVLINWQLSKQGTRWPVPIDRIAGSGVDPSRSNIFWSYTRTSYKFSSVCRLKFNFFLIHLKYVVFMCCTIKIFIANWPRTRKCSQLLQAWKTVAFDFSHHDHALVTIYVQFLCSDWSKFAWCVRGLQSLKRYWLYLIPFRSCISNGKPEKLLYLLFIFCI